LEKASRHCRSSCPAPRSTPAGRTHQPPRPRGDRVARRPARIRVLRRRPHQPRSLLPRKHRHANGRVEPRLSQRMLRANGNYSQFLEAKEEFLHAQARHQEALENRVRVEKEWLRRGPKARATKAKARIDNANRLIAELTDLNARTRTTTADFDFAASGRQTKRLVELEDLSYSIEDRLLFRDLNFHLTAGMRVGLVGPNGSGKTTLMRLLTG